MRFTHLFVPEAVGLRLKSRDFRAAIGELIGALRDAGRVSDDTRARNDVLSREDLGSTYVGEGIAIPHAATPAVNQPLIAYGYSKRGLRYSKDSKTTVHHLFIILGTPAGGPLHLRILARLAGVLDSFDFLQGLEQCESEREVMALIQSRADMMDEIVVPEELPRLTVVYSGANEMALAAHASILGCRVRVLAREENDIRILSSMGGINAQGEIHGFGRLESAGADPAEELEGSDLIIVGPPANRYAECAEWIAPHVHEGQTIALIPGRVGGALSFYSHLKTGVGTSHVYVCESQLPLYESDMPSPAMVRIHRVKNHVPISALPSYALPEVMGLLNSALPYFVSGGNVLQTGLDNISTFIYPAVSILNASRVEERDASFRFFREGMSPSLARVLESLDRERLQIAERLGVNISSFLEWLTGFHNAHGEDLFQAIRSTRAYSQFKAPLSMDEASVVESITHGLVPLVSLGERVDVPTPTARSLVLLASAMLERDFLSEGCTTEAMGIAQYSPEEIRQMLNQGKDTLKER